VLIYARELHVVKSRPDVWAIITYGPGPGRLSWGEGVGHGNLTWSMPERGTHTRHHTIALRLWTSCLVKSCTLSNPSGVTILEDSCQPNSVSQLGYIVDTEISLQFPLSRRPTAVTMRKRPGPEDPDTSQGHPSSRRRLDASPIPEKTYKPWKLPRQKEYVFAYINVVDTVAGKIHPGRTVRIRDGIILSITGTSWQDEIYRRPKGGKDGVDYTVINSAGKFLCPGLIDAHVHLSSVPGTPDLRSAMATPALVSALRQPYQCRAMLERGFTSARDCGGASLALKEAIEEGVFPGPRLFIAGQAISQTGGHGDRRGPHEGGGDGAVGGCCGGGGGGEMDGGLSAVVDGVPGVLAAARTQLRRE
jgi:hypothetical protein